MRSGMRGVFLPDSGESSRMSEWLEIDPEDAPVLERRTDFRHPVELKGEVSGSPLYLSNLSQSGFRALHSREGLTVGQSYPVRLSLGADQLQGNARLVWAREFGSSGKDGGFLFTDVGTPELLDDYLRRQAL